jgi:hypothetical protein
MESNEDTKSEQKRLQKTDCDVFKAEDNFAENQIIDGSLFLKFSTVLISAHVELDA